MTNEVPELFELGSVVATPRALEALRANGDRFEDLRLLRRHASGDWGEVDAEEQAANNRAVNDGTRIRSAYKLADGTKLWVITEADRSATTLLLPEEYKP